MKTSSANIGDHIAACVEIARTGFVADGAGAAAAGITVYGGDAIKLSRQEVFGWSSGREAEDGDDGGEVLHLEG